MGLILRRKDIAPLRRELFTQRRQEFARDAGGETQGFETGGGGGQGVAGREGPRRRSGGGGGVSPAKKSTGKSGEKKKVLGRTQIGTDNRYQTR